MSTHPQIRFFFETATSSLKRRTALKAFIQQLLKKEKRTLDTLNYIFCSDEYLLNINKTYLKHDYYTDIITFDLSDDFSQSAEIYISLDRVKDNAAKTNHSLENELHRVIFHGALHLCGYQDKTAKDKQIMRAMEDKYLRHYFVPRGTKGL